MEMSISFVFQFYGQKKGRGDTYNKLMDFFCSSLFQIIKYVMLF